MSRQFELELTSGGTIAIALPEPGDFPSFYVFSTEYCGNGHFWELLSRLMAAAGGPLCPIHELLAPHGLSFRDVSRASMEGLFREPGYGFGILYDYGPAVREAARAENHKLLFLRDPRDMARAFHQPEKRTASGVASPSGFPSSLVLDRIIERYRRYGELWRGQSNVTLFRYEHALANWYAIAAEIVAVLKLPVDPATTASIAAGVPQLGNRLADADGEAWGVMTDWEHQISDVIAAFGYMPRSVAQRPAETVREMPVEPAPLAPTAASRMPGFGGMFEYDPVLQARLKPNTSSHMEVLGRRVRMEVDATGCRLVVGQPEQGVRTLAVYGCSCTFGNAISVEETFCSLLQAMFPTWRVENHGVPAYCTAQNLIQLERDARWNKPDLVTFCWLQDHLYRNVADIRWVLKKTENMGPGTGREKRELRLPRAALDDSGQLKMLSVQLPRHDLAGLDFSDFEPDRYYLELVCFRLMERAKEIVTGYGGHFFVTTLLQTMSTSLVERLASIGVSVVHASVSGPQYTCLPDDPHPNALAHQYYAKRIRDYLLRHTGAGNQSAAVSLP